MSSGPHSGPTVVLGSSPQETLARLAEEAAEMSAQLRELAERASVAEKQEAQSTRSTPSTQKGETAVARILVADDETVIRVMLARYLRKQGYEVTEAIDGTAALEAAQKEAFDL
ncbi:MAG TPA: response regulator, partial [Gemmatimonadaceae bacterium]|nr:response regulator [Gemmatimonadaceae bacterium]